MDMDSADDAMHEHDGAFEEELGEEFRRGAPPVDCPSPESPAPSPAP